MRSKTWPLTKTLLKSSLSASMPVLAGLLATGNVSCLDPALVGPEDDGEIETVRGAFTIPNAARTEAVGTVLSTLEGDGVGGVEPNVCSTAGGTKCNGPRKFFNFPAIVNGTLFLGGNADHEIWNIANPSAPVRLSELKSPNRAGEAESHQLSFSLFPDGSVHAATISGTGVDLWNISNSAAPVLEKSVAVPGVNYGDNTNAIWGVYFQGKYVYVGATNHGLWIIDATTPTSASLVDLDTVTTGTQGMTTAQLDGVSAGQLWAMGNRLVIVTPKSSAGVVILDISDPIKPVLIDSEKPAAASYSGGFFGKHAYLLSPLRTYDISGSTVVKVGSDMSTPSSEYASFGEGTMFLGTLRGTNDHDANSTTPRVGGVWRYNFGAGGPSAPTQGPLMAGRNDSTTDDQFPVRVGNLVVVADDEHLYGARIMVHQQAADTSGPTVDYVNPPSGSTNQKTTTRVGLSFSDQVELTSANMDTFIVRRSGTTSTNYEGESATMAGGVVTATNWPGYTGTGFADFPTTFGTGVTLTFNVNAASAGTYNLVFRYGNGSTTARALRLKVNGVDQGMLSFVAGMSWTDWRVLVKTASLNAGANTVQLVGETEAGPNIDRLAINQYPVGRYGNYHTTLTFSPNSALTAGTYEVILPAGGIKDVTGNGIAAQWSSTFTVGSGSTPASCGIAATSVIQMGGSASVAATNVNAAFTYSWNFGDSTTGSGSSTSHTYTNPGRYSVRLTVTETANTSNTATCTTTQIVRRPLHTFKPTKTTPILVANGKVWSVDPDNNKVVAINTASPYGVAFEVANLCKSPRTLARNNSDGAIWVACQGDDTLRILNGTTGALEATLNLPRGSQPYGMIFKPDPATNAGFVTLQGFGRVQEVSGNTRTIATRFVDYRDANGNIAQVRGMALHPNGRLLVTRFISPELSPSAPGSAAAAQVFEIDTGTVTAVKTYSLVNNGGSDISSRARGIPNYLTSVVISTDTESKAWIPSKQDNLQRGTGTGRDGQPLTFESAVRPVVSRIDMDTASPANDETSARVDIDNADMPSAAEVSPNGDLLFVAIQGINEVHVLNAYTGGDVAGIAVSLAPQGVVLDAGKLYVQNFMSRTVSVYDVNGILNGTSGSSTKLAETTMTAAASDLLGTDVLTGKQIFYNAFDQRMSDDGYLSCASCHLDGGSDGRVWDFSQFGEGLRNTATLSGGAGMGQGPVHWTGNFDEIQDFEHPIRGFFGGQGFLTDSQFSSSTELGTKKAGMNADLDKLAKYVASLREVPKSPYRNSDGTLTAAAVAGKKLFQNLMCGNCHKPNEFTDSKLNVFHNVGTTLDKRLNVTNTAGYDTPTLMGLWLTPPYFHNGSAMTLYDVLTAAHMDPDGSGPLVAPTLTQTDKDNLVAYLKQIDEAEVTGGLKGDYYDNATATGGGDFTAWKFARVDPMVSFNWSGVPHSSMAADTFSIRWSGKVIAPVSETFTFYTKTDDGVRLWVNGTQLVNQWIDQGATEYSGTIALTAGNTYTITVEYFENAGGAEAALRWSSLSVPKGLIGPESLIPDPTASYEMEAGTLGFGTGSCLRIQAATGASGGNVIGCMNADNDSVTISNVNGGTTGSCRIVLRYSNGSGAFHRLSLFTNGADTGVDFMGTVTSTWTTFTNTLPLSVNLNAGTGNTVMIKRLTGDLALDIDKIDLMCN